MIVCTPESPRAGLVRGLFVVVPKTVLQLSVGHGGIASNGIADGAAGRHSHLCPVKTGFSANRSTAQDLFGAGHGSTTIPRRFRAVFTVRSRTLALHARRMPA